MTTPRLQGVVLAAGESSRLGRQKQLLEYNGATLLELTIQNLSLATGELPLVVLGSEWQEISRRLDAKAGLVIVNEDWRSGQASSLRVAIRSLADTVDAALFAVCDQPRVTEQHYQALQASFLHKPLSAHASFYNDRAGVPAIIPRRLFDRVDALTGDQGARVLLREAGSDVVHLRCDEATLDIDNEADWQRFLADPA